MNVTETPISLLQQNICLMTSHSVNLTSSEVASVLEASAAATSLSWSTTTAKLVLASPATTTQAAASFWRSASLVGFLLSRQCGLALLFVLFQQLGSLLLLHLSIDDLIEALSLLRQRVEACNGRKGKKMYLIQKHRRRQKKSDPVKVLTTKWTSWPQPSFVPFILRTACSGTSLPSLSTFCWTLCL